MPFLENDAVNRVNAHSAVLALAQGAGGLFVLVYLLNAGVPAPLVLCVMAAMTLGRLVLRPAVLPIARRIGVRNTLIAGTVLEAGIFLVLPFVDGPGPALVGVIVVGALSSVLYWTSYHAFFAAIGDDETRGGQIGVREALIALVGIVAPAFGGWALATLGPMIAFGAVAGVQMLAAAPLLRTPNPQVPDVAPGVLRSARLGIALFAADGWYESAAAWLWQIALFTALGQTFTAYGAAMAIAALASAVGGLTLGRMIDLGHGRNGAAVAYAIVGACLLLRAFGYDSPVWATVGAAAGGLAAALQAPAMMTRVYTMAKASPCPLRYHMATEAGWDVGAAAGALAAAALLSAGAPFGAPLLMGLLGAGVAGTLLVASYPKPVARSA
jgi:MFS family permease